MRKIKLNPKIIYTAIGHTVDDYFKFWSAEQVMKGTKYIVSDHGGYIDDKQNFGAWSKFSDLYLRWNLDKKKNTLQMPPSILFKDQDFIKLLNMDNVSFIECDLVDTQHVMNSLGSGYDCVYHFAAINGTKNFYLKPDRVLRTNLLSTINILDWFKNSNSKRILFSSSSEVYAGLLSIGDLLIPTPELTQLCIWIKYWS